MKSFYKAAEIRRYLKEHPNAQVSEYRVTSHRTYGDWRGQRDPVYFNYDDTLAGFLEKYLSERKGRFGLKIEYVRVK